MLMINCEFYVPMKSLEFLEGLICLALAARSIYSTS